MHDETAPQPIRRAHCSVQGLALMSLLLPLAGCTSSPRTQVPFDELAESEPDSEIVPDERPSETGFLGLVQRYCGSLAVGDATIAERLSADSRFRALTMSLYHGDLTNDQYMRRVSTRHAAKDGNVDAAGCVVNQLQKCYAERCSVPTAERPLPERNPPDELEVYGE